MLVSAHAASNWSWGMSFRRRNSTNFPTTPAWMTSAIGGFLSMLSSFRNQTVASSWCSGCGPKTPCTILGSSSSFSKMVDWLFGPAVEEVCMSFTCPDVGCATSAPWPVIDAWNCLLFCICSSLLLFLISMLTSSRFFRASSASMVFLLLLRRCSARLLGRKLILPFPSFLPSCRKRKKKQPTRKLKLRGSLWASRPHATRKRDRGGGEASGGENDGGGANLVPSKLLAVSLSWDLVDPGALDPRGV
mmetsp:Transcript_9345/g.28385  ORF Transcript_9345/g.28385 Transcript_9345/m.28385 type:complete len:247 (+) Transcript_9345:1325-2065(+)